MIINPIKPKIVTLHSRWQKLIGNALVDKRVSEQLFQEIASVYSEKHRYYHNLNHLNHMFNELDSCENDTCNIVSNEMLWAVWYHDYIYKPGAKTNEKKSANKAKESMRKLGIQQSSIDKVSLLILATENHKTQINDISIQLFLDADMAILGTDETKYEKYCRDVRQEHASTPNFLFNRGRKNFLSSVLKQESIFVSPFFHRKYEAIARKNIELEINFLS